jgi:hypothetical protein
VEREWVGRPILACSQPTSNQNGRLDSRPLEDIGGRHARKARHMHLSTRQKLSQHLDVGMVVVSSTFRVPYDYFCRRPR